jgi:hypothetical protein
MVKANGSLNPRNRFAKRHYEAIATAMQEAIERSTSSEMVSGVYKAAAQMADLFAGDNGEFKRDRFIRACEPGANVRARNKEFGE